MTNRRTASAAAIGVMALIAAALPTAALASVKASLPKLTPTLIVINKQLGPVKLKESYRPATKATGDLKAGGCRPGYGCTWGNLTTGTYSFVMATTTTVHTPFVASIGMYAPSKTVKHGTDYETVYLFTGPLAKLRTAKGIGLGSTLKQLQHAYPQAKRTEKFGDVSEYVIEGSGPTATRPLTTFTLTNGRITGLAVFALPLG